MPPSFTTFLCKPWSEKKGKITAAITTIGLLWFSLLELGQALQHVALELTTFPILSTAVNLASPTQLDLGRVPS